MGGLLALTFCVALGAGPVGEPAPANEDRAPRVPIHEEIVVGVVGVPLPQLEVSLRANVGDLGLEVAVESWSDAVELREQLYRAQTVQSSGRAVLWIVGTGDPSRVELFVLPAGSRLAFVRPVVLPGDELERSEALGIIVRTVVEALQAGPPPDMSPVNAEGPPADAPSSRLLPRPPPDRPDSGSEPGVDRNPVWSLGLVYWAGPLAANAPYLQGARLFAEIRAPVGVVGSLGVGVGTGRTRDDVVPLHLVRVFPQVGLGYSALLGVRWWLGAEAIVSPEWVDWVSRGADPEVSDLEGSHWRLQLGADMKADVRLIAGLGLRLGLGLRVPVVDTNLVVVVDGVEQPVLQSFPATGVVEVGLVYVFGPGPRHRSADRDPTSEGAQ